MVFIAIAILLIFIAFNTILNGLNVEKPNSLDKHPNAFWLGGSDGGTFIEIVKDNHPKYQINLYFRNGDIIDSGIYILNDKISNDKVTYQNMSFYNGEIIQLKNKNYLYKIK